MTIQEVNAKILSNGMTRKAYFDSVVDWYSQGGMEYNGYFVKKLNIPYDTVSERQKYDVYMPMRPGLYPTLILVHGGGWFTGDRSDFGLSLVLPYIAHGFTVITVGYRLADEAVYPDPVNDVTKALKQIFANAEEYRMDVNRVAMQAGSAGTTIAALAALENKELMELCDKLEVEIEDLEDAQKTLEAALEAARPYKVKADFMDSYVVFVENNNSGYYHTYDCGNFAKKNFWAYSRKLAESNGFDPCPICGGRP